MFRKILLVSAMLLAAVARPQEGYKPSPRDGHKSGIQDGRGIKALEVEFRKHFSQCKNSYVSRITTTNMPDVDTIIQLKGVRFEFVRTVPLTAADRLNGHDLQQLVRVRFSAGRFFGGRSDESDAERVWTEWQDPKDIWLGPSIEVYVFRSDRKWNVELELGDGTGRDVSYKPMSCSELPLG
jgi:hypothetical protein